MNLRHGRLLQPLVLFAAVIGCGGLLFANASQAAKGNLVDKKCLKCHTEYQEKDLVLGGDFQSLSNQAKSIQVEVGDSMEVIKFTPETQVENVKTIKDLQKPIPVMVYYQEKGPDKVATLIKAKPVIKVPEAQQLDVKQMQELLAKGPDAYMLIDSRPPAAYQEGHVPTAINIPFPAMPQNMDKLPKDKSKLLVFYCGGFR